MGGINAMRISLQWVNTLLLPKFVAQRRWPAEEAPTGDCSQETCLFRLLTSLPLFILLFRYLICKDTTSCWQVRRGKLSTDILILTTGRISSTSTAPTTILMNLERSIQMYYLPPRLEMTEYTLRMHVRWSKKMSELGKGKDWPVFYYENIEGGMFRLNIIHFSLMQCMYLI